MRHRKTPFESIENHAVIVWKGHWLASTFVFSPVAESAYATRPANIASSCYHTAVDSCPRLSYGHGRRRHLCSGN